MNATAARRSRTLRLSAAALTAAAALTLTACGSDGDGVRRSGSADISAPSDSAGASGAQDAGPSSTGGSADSGSEAPGNGDGPAAGTGGKTGPAEKAATSGGSRQAQPDADASASGTKTSTCTTAQVSLKVSKITRPINHLVLQATNTSKTTCYAYGYPYLGFDEAQATTPPFEDSKPQAVVTLAPGETAYAGIAYFAADGSGTNPRKATKLSVSFAGPDQAGSVGGQTELTLPAGLTIDDSARVTYWQSSLSDATMW